MRVERHQRQLYIIIMLCVLRMRIAVADIIPSNRSHIPINIYTYIKMHFRDLVNPTNNPNLHIHIIYSPIIYLYTRTYMIYSYIYMYTCP